MIPVLRLNGPASNSKVKAHLVVVQMSDAYYAVISASSITWLAPFLNTSGGGALHIWRIKQRSMQQSECMPYLPPTTIPNPFRLHNYKINYHGPQAMDLAGASIVLSGIFVSQTLLNTCALFSISRKS